jgi:hypothetical protein
MEDIVVHLLFKEYQKKPTKYTRSMDINSKTPKTFYVHTGENVTIVTKIRGVKETSNTLQRGDVLITGPKGERYVVGAGKFLGLYNVNEEIAIPRALPRMVARLTRSALRKGGHGTKDTIVFTAPWGETMIAKIGDYIVKDGDGHYRVEKTAFLSTYVRSGK